MTKQEYDCNTHGIDQAGGGPGRRRGMALGLLLSSLLGGCMLTPSDDGRVVSTSAPLSVVGYDIEPDALVQVQAWDFGSQQMANVGAPVRSSTTAINVADQPLYEWDASPVLDIGDPAHQLWRRGPAGGYCANVGATTTLSNGQTYSVMTVESNWLSCFNEVPNHTVGGFYSRCKSNHNPVAQIYTADWAPITVTQSSLNQAAQIASQSVHIKLDDYQPHPYLFCNSGNPAGCPPGLASDPETYKFYNPPPYASFIQQGSDDPLNFQITPSRSDPMTVYIDDMSSTQLYFYVSNTKFVVGIKFEGNDIELPMDCIRHVGCGGNYFLDFPSPSAELSFDLVAHGGNITYSDVSTVFTTGLSGNANADRAAAAIAAAITDKLLNDPAIHSAISDALDQIVKGAAWLNPFPLAGVTVQDGVLQVQAGCPVR
jgi:hypothetical protein